MGQRADAALRAHRSVVGSPVVNRWKIFLAALAGSAVLAVVFALGVDRLVMSDPQTPHLKTISEATLSSRYGVTLGAAAQPPYCGLQQMVAKPDWLSTFLPQRKPTSGVAGCPISKQQAEAAAVGKGPGRVVESLLARVNSTWNPQVRDRLAWVIVVRGTIFRSFRSCGVLVYPMPANCYGSPTGWTSDRVVVVDGFSGQMLQTQRLIFIPSPVVTPSTTQRG